MTVKNFFLLRVFFFFFSFVFFLLYFLLHLFSFFSFHVRGYHPLWPAFPSCSVKSCAITCRLFRFRSPLLSESRLMSFPRATEMFQFTRFASHDYVFIMRYLSVGFPIRKSPDQS